MKFSYCPITRFVVTAVYVYVGGGRSPRLVLSWEGLLMNDISTTLAMAIFRVENPGSGYLLSYAVFVFK